MIWRWLTRAALLGAMAAHPKMRQAAAVVGAIVAFGLGYWFLTSFFVTLDTIESVWLRAGFVAAVAALVALVSIGALAGLGWLQRTGSRPTQPRPPSRERLDQLYAKHGIAAPRTTVMPSGAPGTGPAVAVIGLPNVGRTTLIKALAETFAAKGGSLAPRFVELPALEADAGAASDAVTLTADFDAVLLVVTDDLKSHEMAALETVTRAGKPAVVALAKSDLLRGEERSELLAALADRVAALSPRPQVVPVSADPTPMVVEVISAEGPSGTVVRKPARTVAPLADAIEQVMRHRGRGGRSVG